MRVSRSSALVGIPFFSSRFEVPPFPAEEAFHQLRGRSEARLPGEKVADWGRLFISEMALGSGLVLCLLSYAYCATSDAEWVALPGIISVLLSIGVGFGMGITLLGFGITSFFAQNYFTQRRFYAGKAASYSHFEAEFRPYHDKAVRNFAA